MWGAGNNVGLRWIGATGSCQLRSGWEHCQQELAFEGEKEEEEEERRVLT